ncbi:MAG: SCO family protein [Anaerolineales bacterium]|nr:SCO family protein [Anaerolineales bacterium]
MNNKTLRTGIIVIFVIILAVVANLLFAGQSGFRGTAYNEPYPLAPYFELTDSNGDLFRLSDQRGKIVLLFFGYTSCPDVCPTTLAELNLALKEIGGKASSVQVVLVSVDPDRDTPQRVQEYVSRFNPSFIGLSGTTTELQNIWTDYDIFREIVQSDSGIIVNHTARTILIDNDVKMRLSYGFGTPVDDIVHDLELILK